MYTKKMSALLGILVGFFILTGTAGATIILTGTSGDCTYLKPGQTKVFTLSLEEEENGQYIVALRGNGLDVYPTQLDLYLEEGKTATRFVRVRAPISVVDDYFMMEIFVYRADNEELVESKDYCFHVYKGIMAKEGAAPDIAFGYRDARVSGGEVHVTLFISNLGRLPAVVTLDSDYGRVSFRENPLVVKGYRTVETEATIPLDESLPEFITIYANIGGAQKKVTIRMPIPEAVKPEVDMEVPEKIIVDKSLTKFTARIKNRGDTEITVVLGGSKLPLGVAIYSDEVKVEPGKTVNLVGYVVPGNVLRPGTYLVQVCAKDPYGAKLACKYTVMSLKSEEKVRVVETSGKEGYMVDVYIENGARAYKGVEVKVEAPAGWKYTVEPEIFDLEAYSKKTVSVTFLPEKNAEEGTALIKIVAPDGRVLIRKSVKLSPAAITGYATVGAASAIGWLVAAVVIAFVLAMIIKRGKEVTEEEIEEFKELTKKE